MAEEKTKAPGGVIDIGGRKVPVWVIGAGVLGAVGLYLLTRLRGSAGGSSGLASAQYDQSIRSLKEMLDELAKRIGTQEPGGGTTPTPAPLKGKTFATWNDLANDLATENAITGAYYSTIDPTIHVIDTRRNYVYVEKFNRAGYQGSDAFVKAVKVPRSEFNLSGLGGGELVGVPEDVWGLLN